jgi:hypothetical protein
MRRSLVSALVATFLLSLAGGSRGGDTGASAPPSIDTDTGGLGARDSVLIYHGHGGVGPEGLEGSMTHQESSVWLEGAGLTVEQTATWPDSFDTYRLIILPGPGANDSSDALDVEERASLIAAMNDGAVVVVEAEPGSLLNDEVLNALVWDLSGSMYSTGEALDGPAEPWGDHQLTAGVETVGLDLCTVIERGEETCLLVAGDDCVAASAMVGAGWLVLLGDGNLLSDVSRWSDGGHDNARFLSNLAQLY